MPSTRRPTRRPTARRCHEANAPTAATGTPKGADVTDGSVSGEVCLRATEALQRLINHLCIVEHMPVPTPIYFSTRQQGSTPG